MCSRQLLVSKIHSNLNSRAFDSAWNSRNTIIKEKNCSPLAFYLRTWINLHPLILLHIWAIISQSDQLWVPHSTLWSLLTSQGLVMKSGLCPHGTTKRLISHLWMMLDGQLLIRLMGLKWLVFFLLTSPLLIGYETRD